VVGILVIGGVLTWLWIEFGPWTDGASDEAAVPALANSRAVVKVAGPGLPRGATSTITCDGLRRTATGFWADNPREACDALASTGDALVDGPGCRALDHRQLRIAVTGTFEGREFAHRQQRGGCPDDDGWLAVNALVEPVAIPERKAAEPST
jgi:hypothetical protein